MMKTTCNDASMIKRQMPRDLNQLAKAIVDAATEEDEGLPVETKPETSEPEKDPAAVALGRRGGLKGGPARAAKMTAKQRSTAAKKAAKARWEK